MPFDSLTSSKSVSQNEEPRPLAALDRFVQGTVAGIGGGRSPIGVTEAWSNWLFHLMLSPGKQLDLMLSASAAAARLCAPAPEAVDDAWRGWPFSLFREAHRASEAWWREAATGVRGVSARHQRVIEAGIGQWFHAVSPANNLLTNPELLRLTRERGGANLLAGARLLADDLTGGTAPDDGGFKVGETLAITRGKVVFRNRLIELIQYAPATPSVHPEPILIVPAWIMKYYILDLRPENSLIRFLVEQGHTVFTISWHNPTAADADLTMEDYRQSGVMAALDTIGSRLPGQRVHAAGYCLGGTMLTIAAAAMARAGDHRLASVTLLAAQTDFTEPGELKLFIDDSDLSWLESLMARDGGLDGGRMAAAFQMLRADDLIWTPFLRRYLRGEADHPNDLMVWNADQTRMPFRMHTDYLRELLLENRLARGQFVADGGPVALRDVRVPVFALGTAKDHVAPWRSVYKITLLTRSDVTFALVSGGHNAGVVSEPGHKGRTYRVLTMPADGLTIDPDAYLARAEVRAGSWWPEWQAWLAERSGARVAPPPMPDGLCDAPGTYVLER